MVPRISPMNEKDTSERLNQILDLAMLANPWATKNKYREFLLSTFHEFPRLSFVAVDRGRIAGYVMGDANRGAGEVEDIAVLPAYRGRGLGRRLMRVELGSDAKTRSKASHALGSLEKLRNHSILLQARLSLSALGSGQGRPGGGRGIP